MADPPGTPPAASRPHSPFPPPTPPIDIPPPTTPPRNPLAQTSAVVQTSPVYAFPAGARAGRFWGVGSVNAFFDPDDHARLRNDCLSKLANMVLPWSSRYRYNRVLSALSEDMDGAFKYLNNASDALAVMERMDPFNQCLKEECGLLEEMKSRLNTAIVKRKAAISSGLALLG